MNEMNISWGSYWLSRLLRPSKEGKQRDDLISLLARDNDQIPC